METTHHSERTFESFEHQIESYEDYLFVFDGQTCPYHHHDVKHETIFILKGTMKMVINGEERIMKKGDTFIVNTGVLRDDSVPNWLQCRQRKPGDAGVLDC